MADKYLRIGSMENIHIYDDGDYDSAVETDAPIKAGAPSAVDDVVRLQDITDGLIVDGDQLDITWNPTNYVPDATIAEAADVDDLSAHLKGIDTLLGNKTTGPASSIDNAIVRFNGTTGKVVQNSGVLVSDSNELYQFIYKFISPNSITLIAGTSANSVSDLQTPFDGNTYDIQEAAATPGYHLEVNFTGVTTFNAIYTRFEYAGSATHCCEVSIYNNSTASWDSYSCQLGNQLGMQTIHIPICLAPSNYINSGTVIMRFYHPQAGNASHNLYIDYAALIN